MRRDGARRPRPSEEGAVLAQAAMILDMSCCATILLRRTCSIRETSATHYLKFRHSKSGDFPIQVDMLEAAYGRDCSDFAGMPPSSVHRMLESSFPEQTNRLTKLYKLSRGVRGLVEI